jgi:hypothetical protein
VKRLTPAVAIAALIVAGFGAIPGCGYRVSGRADLLPKSIRTIAIPAFGNLTTRYKLADRLPAEVGREFLRRTRYEIVADPGAADAILNGSVLSYNAFPTVIDPVSSRAAGIQLSVVLQLRLTDRESGKVLFDRPAFEARQRYEISIDQVAYLEENVVALERLSREVARGAVSAILEGF